MPNENIERKTQQGILDQAAPTADIHVNWGEREVVKPEELGVVGVTSDGAVRPLRFVLPRYYEGYDLSEFGFRINYVNAAGEEDIYRVVDPQIGESEISFIWLLSRFATAAAGEVRFVVCGVRLADDGETIEQEINSTIASFEVLQGMEVEERAEFDVRLDWLARELRAIEGPILEAEGARRDAEAAREAAEFERASAERTRGVNETVRLKDEAARKVSENERVSAEIRREAEFADIVSVISQAKIRVLAEDEYDADGTPVLDGVEGIIYFVPVDGKDGADNFIEWVLVDGKWERIGTTQANLATISPDDIGRVAAEESPQGNELLSLSGLSYLWSKLKAKFSALVHKHDAADIDSGVLSGMRGGTGMQFDESGSGFIYKREGNEYCGLVPKIESDQLGDGCVTESAL